MDKGIALVTVIDQVVQYGDETVRIHPYFLQFGVEGFGLLPTSPECYKRHPDRHNRTIPDIYTRFAILWPHVKPWTLFLRFSDLFPHEKEQCVGTSDALLVLFQFVIVGVRLVIILPYLAQPAFLGVENLFI